MNKHELTFSTNSDLDGQTDDDSRDNHVDTEIQDCIRNWKNFFMFAGAGSGKTRSLVNTLRFIADKHVIKLSVRSQQVAVITYTNAACDEIMRRIGYNQLFAVSTIHSFAWELIKSFQRDIKTWVEKDIDNKLIEQNGKLAKAKKPEKYHNEIAKLNAHKENLKKIFRFNYNPNGENIERDSLNHAQVISMGSDFIRERRTMQQVLMSRYPILLIDESQDTKKELVDALFSIDKEHVNNFLIGMFGDTMQRIYMDGKENLPASIPDTWEQPSKIMNHRSTKRIIQLANAIRKSIDGQWQQPRSDKNDGFVRLFVASSGSNKDEIESFAYATMAEITKDKRWALPLERKILVLEHSMAADRLGFSTIDEALRKTFSQSYLDGSMTEIAFLMKSVFPMIEAQRNNDRLTVMKILREKSPFLKKENLQSAQNQSAVLRDISAKVTDIASLWANDNDPTSIDVYSKLYETKLFELPGRIEDVLSGAESDSERVIALRKGFLAPFSEVVHYWDYITDKSPFATHQGIKGLEFERVAVIMDDENSGGNFFSYEKLFGAKALSETDRQNISEGKDDAISRTKRLFYVTCTRAKDSLALIAYTGNQEAVKKTACENCWFAEDEVVAV